MSGAVPAGLPSGKRILVTGGAGFLGSHTVEHLVRVGNEVTVLDNLATGNWANLAAVASDVQMVEGDVRDRDTVDGLVGRAELVYHMAILNLRLSLGDPWSNAEVNSMGSLSVAIACAKHGVERMTYCSSSEVYGSMPHAGSVPAPRTVYASSKLAGELHTGAIARAEGLPVTIVRPFNAYGPHCHLWGPGAEVVPRFALRLRAGWPLPVFGEGHQTRVFTWAPELAYGIALAGALDGPLEGPFDLAYPRTISVREIAETLAEKLTGKPPNLLMLPDRPGDVASHHADPVPARERMGYEAKVVFEEGAERFLEWLERVVPDPMTILGHENREDERNW